MKSHQICELCVLEHVRHHLHLFWMPGNHRQVRRVCVYVWLHVWLHMRRLKRIVVIWQKQCLGIARKGGDTRSQNNGLVPCKMHTRTGLSVQRRRQMWIFIIQLRFDNALDMPSKKNEARISTDEREAHMLWIYYSLSHFSFRTWWEQTHLPLFICH